MCGMQVHWGNAPIMTAAANIKVHYYKLSIISITVDGLVFVGYQFSWFSWRVRSTKSSTHEKAIFCKNYAGKCYGQEF